MFRVKSVQLVTKINAQRSTRRATKPFTRMTALPNMSARASPLMATMEVKIANKCRSRNAKRFASFYAHYGFTLLSDAAISSS